MTPRPPALDVAPLVGGKRSLPEGHAHQEGARHPERTRQWGPPHEDLDRRTALLALLGLLVALGASLWLFGWRPPPDRYLLVLLVPALVLGRARRYAIDFVPFAALLVFYGKLRELAHSLHPHFLPQLDVDKFIFGTVPSKQLQLWLWTGTPRWYDDFLLAVMQVHFIAPPLLAFALWVKRRALFYRFATTLLALSFLAVPVFYLFPAAPPWAAGAKGVLPGVVRISHDPDQLWAGGDNYQALISRVGDPNPYAAIPSLHAGYAFLCFIFVASLAWRSRWRWWVLGLGSLYPLTQSFAVVYTGNHYVFDVVIGYALSAAAFTGVAWFWRRRRLPA